MPSSTTTFDKDTSSKQTELDQQLLVSAQQGDLAGVTSSLTAGANINCRDAKCNLTSIDWAVFHGYEAIYDYLAEKGALFFDSDRKINNKKRSCLHYAVYKVNDGSINLLKKITAREPDLLSTKDIDDLTPIELAYKKQNTQAVNFFLSQKNSPSSFLRDHIYKNATVSRTAKDYQRNHTAALSSEAFSPNKKTPKQYAQHVEHTKELIIEHAARRIDLAFYTFIAYYNSGLKIEIGNTQLQFGKGGKTDCLPTDACHSAHISTFLDSTAIGSSRESILTNSFFHQSLNATIQLPRVVNHLDIALEGKLDTPSSYRKNYLQLINQVSRDELTPIAALEAYLTILRSFFDPTEPPQYLKNSGDITPNEARQLAFLYEREGTLRNDCNRKAYIHMMLRLFPEEISIAQEGGFKAEEIYASAYLKIQTEILSHLEEDDALAYTENRALLTAFQEETPQAHPITNSCVNSLSFFLLHTPREKQANMELEKTEKILRDFDDLFNAPCPR